MRHLAAPFENGQESLADVFVVQKLAVHERKLAADQLGEVGMQRQMPLLGVEKNAHQPARRVAEDAVVRRADLTVHKNKSVHRLR